jgi:hypothetical protein
VASQEARHIAFLICAAREGSSCAIYDSWHQHDSKTGREVAVGSQVAGHGQSGKQSVSFVENRVSVELRLIEWRGNITIVRRMTFLRCVT